MSLTERDIERIRGIVREEVKAVVKAELDEYAKRIGPVLADHVEFQSKKLRLDVQECLKTVSAELKTGLEKVSKATAQGEREIFTAINELTGEVGPLGPRISAVELMLQKVYKAQHTDIDQGASIRDAVLGVEKSAITEVPPAFEGELGVNSEQKTDAERPTEAE